MVKSNTPLVMLAAGLSKRFGGRLKQLARIGPEGETLIEYSIRQAKNAGFKEIIIIVGDKTESPLKEVLGTEHEEIRVQYAKQEYDQKARDAPWGTLDALCATRQYLNRPFVVCNSDDIYGESAMRDAKNILERNKENIAIGYRIKTVLPQTGAVNRGIFDIEREYVISIKEEIGISLDNISARGISSESLCSMNLFGLTEETLKKLEKRLLDFKKKNEGNRTIECLLPEEIGSLLKDKQITMRISQTENQWHGLTHPQDEEEVRKELIKNN